MTDLRPQGLATLFQPGVECQQIIESWCIVPDAYKKLLDRHCADIDKHKKRADAKFNKLKAANCENSVTFTANRRGGGTVSITVSPSHLQKLINDKVEKCKELKKKADAALLKIGAKKPRGEND